uniref:Zinc finger MYND domain-containing protein 11 n=1 Tax=Diabrotica virgifera virgifera TaxID=50390 RepID=A0A6P7GDG9_DIAVI
MTTRRQTDPIQVVRIWDAIRTANHQRISADVTKITKYLQTLESDYTSEKVDLYLKQALNDKLICPVKKGEPNNTYKIPMQEEPNTDGKDWYCFECHLAGEVIECTKCCRVFHRNCIRAARRRFDTHRGILNFANHKVLQRAARTKEAQPGTSSDPDTIVLDDEPEKVSEAKSLSNSATFDESKCSICNTEKIDISAVMEKAELNYVLKFVLTRIRNWLPKNITRTMAPEDQPEWMSESELTWRASQLFCEHTDMSVIEVKLNTETYTKFAEFLGDILTVQHNITIFHGNQSQEYGAAELMVRDTLHDLTELTNCVDCYKHSNEKINAKWFCLPCRVPHELVWAKQKGYPYWPAKIIRVIESNYDVRFFGGKYERATLKVNSIKDIDTPREQLMIKPSSAADKALEELRYHQRLINDPIEVERLISESKQKRKSLPKPQPSLPKTPAKTPAKTPVKTSKINANMPSTSKQATSKKSKSKPSTSSSKNSPNVSSTRASKRKLSDTNKTTHSSTSKTVDVNSEETKKPKTSTAEANSTNVIDISDGEIEDCEEYSYRQNTSTESFSREESYEQVTSSTENFGKSGEPGMLPLDQPYSDSVEKMRRKLEDLPNKKEIIKCAMDCMQIEIDKIGSDHNEYIKRLFESHNQQISDVKKRQWCYNCEQEAIYHCCWNTAYCSQTCQQQHWIAEHKRVCRRKR